MSSGTRLPIFNVGARFYDWLTDQDLWRHQVASMQVYFPDLERPLRVLDLGCGPGVSTFALAETMATGTRLVGIDLATNMIDRAKLLHRLRYTHLEGIEFHVADATSLSFEDDAFDAAIGHSFLYLVPDRVAVLREVRRVLAPGGALVLMEPDRDGSLSVAWPALRDERAADGTRTGRWRFLTSMVLWRIASNAAGQMNTELVESLFDEGGFDSVTCHHTLGGLGLHCIGR